MPGQAQNPVMCHSTVQRESVPKQFVHGTTQIPPQGRTSGWKNSDYATGTSGGHEGETQWVDHRSTQADPLHPSVFVSQVSSAPVGTTIPGAQRHCLHMMPPWCAQCWACTDRWHIGGQWVILKQVKGPGAEHGLYAGKSGSRMLACWVESLGCNGRPGLPDKEMPPPQVWGCQHMRWFFLHWRLPGAGKHGYWDVLLQDLWWWRWFQLYHCQNETDLIGVAHILRREDCRCRVP